MCAAVPASIRSTMQALTDGLLFVLGDRLVGVYLGGSLSLGDFYEASSDLDFLVVTRTRLSLEDALAIELLHRDLLKRERYAARLEGDYAPLDLLVPEGTRDPVPGCERGRFLPRVGEIMLSADNIYNMREHGLTMYGPDPREVLPAVGSDKVRAAVRDMMRHPPGLRETPEEATSEVLNLLRSAAALELGRPTTKTEGVQWGRRHLGAGWRAMIESAVAIRKGEGTPLDHDRVLASVADLHQTILAQVGSH